jgi:transcriptional regulator with XRE-family HTH domain
MNSMKKISQNEIAIKAGIAQPSLSNILMGRRRPSWNIAKRLAMVTGSTPDIWMDGNTEILRQIISNVEPPPQHHQT